MDSPLAPKPILPGLSMPRVERGSGDRRRKGHPFEDELAGEHDEPHGHGPPRAPAPPAHPPLTPAPDAPAPPRHPPAEGEVGAHLDLEA